MCLTICRRKDLSFTQALATPLDRITALLQRLDPTIARNDTGDLFADLLRPAGEGNKMRAGWVDDRSELCEHLPLRSRLADARTGDLGAERDATLGRGLCPATGQFVAGRGREQQHRLARIDEHLAAHDDVLVHAQRHLREDARDLVGVGHRLRHAEYG